jgi:hypothetical protein
MFERFFAMLKNYKLIRFADGNYGIRKGFFYYKYKDLKDTHFWWRGNAYERYFKDCRCSLAEVVKILNALQNNNNDYVVVPFKSNIIVDTSVLECQNKSENTSAM